MPALLLTNNSVSIPALVALRVHLDAVFVPTPTNSDYSELTLAAASAGVPLHTLEPDALLEEVAARVAADPSLVLVTFGFPLRIPAPLLHTVGHRFYNVHFSLLPKYAGPIPVFWQLRAGDPAGGVTIHQVTERFDAGPIAAQQPVHVYPGETYGLYNARLAQVAVSLLGKLLDKLALGELPSLQPQPEGRSYQRKPRAKDLRISWATQTAAEIENLVNACNPVAVGAWTFYAGQPLQIVEVSPADGAFKAAPGTIVHTDPAQGLFVCCSDGQLLRINIARLAQGTLSGGKLAALGFRARTRFEDLEPQAIPNVSY